MIPRPTRTLLRRQWVPRPLGAVLDMLMIRRQLAAIFEYRRRRVDALFGAGTAASAR